MSTSEGPEAAQQVNAHEVRGRAEVFRASLGPRQEADAMLTEAAEVRRQAGLQAERLVTEAEQLGRELTEQAKTAAAELTAEARERADGILLQARQSAESIRAEARQDAEAARTRLMAELEAENQERLHGVRHRAEELLAGMDRIIRGLGSTIQQAEGSVAEVERTLSHLRHDTVAQLPETPAGPSPRSLAEAAATAEQTARTRTTIAAIEAMPPSAAPPAQAVPPAPSAGTGPSTPPSGPGAEERDAFQGEDDQRPLGWLFRSTRS